MYTINVWSKFHLYRQKSLVFLLLGCLFSLSAVAQPSSIRLLNFDKKNIHYGFQIGIFSSFLNVNHSQHFVDGSDSTFAISPNRTYSFSLGFVLNKALPDELWDIRILPNVSFYNHSIRFDYPTTSTTEIIERPSTFIEVPVLFKYKSIRRKNHRMYMLGGLTPGIGVGGKKGTEGQRSLTMNNINLEVTYGVGISGYMQLFNFSPEIRISHGLMNMLNKSNNIFANNLDRITTHKIALVFNFEG